MVHGQPDFGMTSKASTIHRLTDMGELAARLGSISAFDRRGDFVWYDSFEDGLSKRTATGTGTGNSQEVVSDLSLYGFTSVKLTGGSDGSRLASLDKAIAYPVFSNFGLEFAWNLGTAINTLRVSLMIQNSTGLWKANIRYDDINNKLQYYTEPATYVDLVDPFNLPSGGTLFNIWKVVVDMDTKEYVRFIHNNIEYDLSGIDMDETLAAYSPRLYVQIVLTSRLGENDYIYGDYVIVTQNEP